MLNSFSVFLCHQLFLAATGTVLAEADTLYLTRARVPLLLSPCWDHWGKVILMNTVLLRNFFKGMIDQLIS